jgi:Uma2 family endonuclease
MSTHVKDKEATANTAARASTPTDVRRAVETEGKDDEAFGADSPHAAILLRFASVSKRMTEEEFFDFCQQQEDDVRLELTSEGDLLIMSPTGAKTGRRNFKLTARLAVWVEQDATGYGFDSNAGFRLPNGAMRSPDFSWIRKERWDAIAEDEQERFAPVCPDFVVELRSRTDSLKSLQRKMEEYVAGGAQLGWLIDPRRRRVHVYRPQAEPEVLDDPQTLSGDPVLPGLTLELKEIWD